MGIFKRGGREGVPTLTWRARGLRRVGPRRAPDAHPGWLEEKASPPPRPAKFKSPSPALGPLLTDESPSSWDTPPHLSHSPHGCPQALAPLPPAGAAPCPARCREAAGRPLPPALGTSPRSLAIPLRPSAARPAQAHPAVPGASSRPSPSRPSWPGPPAARPPPPRRPFRPAPPRRSAPLPPGFLRRGCPPTWAWVSTSRAPQPPGPGLRVPHFCCLQGLGVTGTRCPGAATWELGGAAGARQPRQRAQDREVPEFENRARPLWEGGL